MLNFSDEDVALMKSVNIIPEDCPDKDVEYFLSFCNSKGLNPLLKEVYLTSRWDKKLNKGQGGKVWVHLTGIDGYRVIANRTGDYAGSDDPTYNGSYTMAEVSAEKPEHPDTCTVTVYKMVQGNRCPFSATARWEEYKPSAGQDFMWKRMAYLMLAKVAEALALRKAFPDALGGVYTEDEIYGTTYDVNYVKGQGVDVDPTPSGVSKEEVEEAKEFLDKITPDEEVSEDQQEQIDKEEAFEKEGKKKKAPAKKKKAPAKKKEEPEEMTGEEIKKLIDEAETKEDLISIYNNNPSLQTDQELLSALSNKKAEIQKSKKEEAKSE